MPTVQLIAFDPTAQRAARSGTMRTPYNESGEHLEDDEETETLSDPDETGMDLLEETRLEEEHNDQLGQHAMEVDGRYEKTTTNSCSNNASATPQRSKQLSRKDEKLRQLAALMDSDDENDEYLEILARKKLAKAQRQQQQQEQAAGLHVNNHQDLSADASHDTEVIANTSSTPPPLPKKRQGGYSFEETQQWERELRAVENLENNASPTPVPNHRRTTVDKVDDSFLESSQWQLPSQIPSQLPSQMTQSSEWRRQSNSNTPNNNRSALQKDKETWQEEAFRSALVDLLKTVPYSYFTSKESTMNKDFWLGTCGANATNDESQDSITSQQVASAQLQRQRCFDAAARSLARLAIASRYIRPNGKKSKDSSLNSNMEEDSPDCSPPTPRTLPSFMSVLNVIDSAENSGFSKDLFCGQSVHGRNARTVYLPNGYIDFNAKKNTGSKSSNQFEFWTLEQMAVGAMKVAAQVCHEAASVPNFDRTCPENEAPSYRVAGFVTQNPAAKHSHEEKHSVSTALVESSLEFLATAFACLESDLVYAVLRSPLQSNNTSNVLVFDAITYFAPSATTEMNNSSAQNASTIPMLALLTLSRGLEAAHFVTRYATSLDPSSICATYTSPHSLGEEGYIGQKQNINFGVDEGGVGYLSAVSRDLGLSIESNEGMRRLKGCAEYAYDCILDFDPIIVDDGADSLYNGSGHVFGNSRKTHNSFRLGLKVDTHVRQDMASAYRCPSLVKDRIFSSAVEYLSSMVQVGVVSTWLSLTSIDGEPADARTVDKLCQKLQSVIETRVRMRRSTNQSTKNDCDNEAVCASAMNLLILLLPRHVEQPMRHTSLSTSFRNMGDESTGNISDLFQSSMVLKLVDLALSWEDVAKESSSYEKYYASNNAILILSTFLMAGAGTLIEETAPKQLETFLQRVTECICTRGEVDYGDDPYVASALSLLLHLHTDCPLLVRQFLRDYVSSNSDVQSEASFTCGLIYLCTTKSFAVASCASSLLRALIEGNPVDRTEDVLSELLLKSFDSSETIFDAMDTAFYAIHQTAETSIEDKENLSGLECVRWHPRLCLLSDMLDKCSSSVNFYRCIKVSLDADDADLTDIFVQFCNPDSSRDHVNIDILTNSIDISLLTLFARFAVKSMQFQNDEARKSFSTSQEDVADKLLGQNAFVAIETSMMQGSSIDLMHRALKIQNLMLSLHSDERYVARSFTRLTSAVRKREEEIRTKLARSEQECIQLTSSYKQMVIDRDSLTNALHDQRSLYEHKLELMRTEVQMKARAESKIHAQERKIADERTSHYRRDLQAEQESRRAAERDNERISKVNERLTHEMSRNKSRIQELEEILAEERKLKHAAESELEKRTSELSLASEELQQMTKNAEGMQVKLAATEESVSLLTAIREDSEAKLEDTCEKLLKLADIYRNKETDMKNMEKQFHSAYKKATQKADNAHKRYVKETERNDSLARELEEVKIELDEVKTNKAQRHRMRTNAPVAYLNSMHNRGNNGTQKPHGRSRRGKENSLE